MRKRHRNLLQISAAILICLISILGICRAESQPSKKPGTARVAEVHDGDTISIILGNGRREKVRLTGIDTPELGQHPWGQKAKQHLEDLIMLSDKTVSCEYDIEKRDKYGRLLCYIWTSQGTMLNLRMVQDGFAMLYTFPPNVRYVTELQKAQREARGKRKGIWGSDGLKERPGHYRKQHPRW
jgi:micrococcal nuclease